ncbi:MAG: hypothetical protein AAF502_25735 [Bacteroidota bacterium]
MGLCIPALLVSALCIFYAESTCQLLINEINADNPQNLESLEFIELKQVNCANRRIDLSGYRILVVKGLGTSKQPEIEGVISLPRGFVTLPNGLFVIGDEAVTPTPQLLFSNDKVVLRQKFYLSQQSGGLLRHFALSNGNVVPFGILLLKIAPTDILTIQSKLQISRNKQFIPLNEAMMQLLSPFIIDVVVYCRRSGFTTCSVFEDLVPAFRGKDYILRDWEAKGSGKPDHSLNRCTDNFLPYQYLYFKLGKPSPMAENDCTGLRFVLSNQMQANADDAPADIPSVYEPISDVMQGPESSCRMEKSPLKRSQIVRMTDESMMAKRKKEDDASCSYDAPREVSTAEADISAITSRQRVMVDGISSGEMKEVDLDETKKLSSAPDWEQEKYFKKEWEQFLATKMGDRFDIKWLDTYKARKWLEVLPNHEEPAKTVFRCRICLKYYDQYLDPHRNKPLLSKPEGITLSRQDKTKNREKISEHLQKKGLKCKEGSGSQAVRTGIYPNCCIRNK